VSTTSLRPGTIVTGPLLPAPVKVQVIVPIGDSVKLIGKGMRTGMFRDPVWPGREGLGF
jgi:hypothetical protein